MKKAVRVDKGWGYELHIHNDDGYCGKILHFNEGARFSMHFHMKKHETWYVYSGRFSLRVIDTGTADVLTQDLSSGDVVVIPMGVPHQLIALESGDIFETSTPDDIQDSYRVEKGDSQKC